MANQLLPLAIKPPNFDGPGAIRRFQDYQMNEERLKNAQMDNELAGLNLEGAKDQFGAEQDFRRRTKAGDPNADDALAGYPEMQKKIWDAFDGMKPAEYKKAKQRAFRFGEAARNILLYQDGSPEQAEAWNDEISKLVDEKVIDADQGQKMIEGGPNPLLIEQALSVEQWTKLHERRREKAEADDRARDIAAGKEEGLLAREKVKEEGRNSREAMKEEGRNSRAATDDTRLDKKADADIARIESVIEKNRRTDGGKGSNEDAVVRDEIKASLKDFRENLDLTNDEDAAKYDAYRTKVFKNFGYGPDGRRLPAKDTKAAADRPVRTATNKKTGEKVQWDYDQEKWVPVE